MASTKHVFQVRKVYQSRKGYNVLAINDLLTDNSRTTNILEFAKIVYKGNPTKYQLKGEEFKQSINPDSKTRQVILGKFFLESC